jgi:hypothetical protein
MRTCARAVSPASVCTYYARVKYTQTRLPSVFHFFGGGARVFSPPPFAMKKPPPSRPRSESFEQYNGWGPFYRQILRAHISAPPQKTLLPIARRTVRFRRPVLHVQGGTRREKTFGQQARLVLARRRSQQAPRSARSAARRAAPAMPREGGVGIRPPSERASSDFQTVKWVVRRLEARVVHGATHLFGRSRPRGRLGRPRGPRRAMPSMRAERCLSARHETRLMAAGVGVAGVSARCDRVEMLVHLLQKHELVQWLPLAPLVDCLV